MPIHVLCPYATATAQLHFDLFILRQGLVILAGWPWTCSTNVLASWTSGFTCIYHHALQKSFLKIWWIYLMNPSSPGMFIVGRLLFFYYLNGISYYRNICLYPLDLILVGHMCLVIYIFIYSTVLNFGGDSFSMHALILCILLVSVVMPPLHNFTKR